jgi:hypothetical protein
MAAAAKAASPPAYDSNQRRRLGNVAGSVKMEEKLRENSAAPPAVTERCSNSSSAS